MKHQRQKLLMLITNSVKAAITPVKILVVIKTKILRLTLQALNNLGVFERCFTFFMDINSLK